MALKHAFWKARKILDGLPPDGRQRVDTICQEIRKAQTALLREGESLMEICLHQCQGLCCRNIDEESLITAWDFIYILATEQGLEDRIAARLQYEDPIFPSDCLFLQDGVGPCLFPSDVRPERCLTAFCFDTAPVKPEIRRVQMAFHKLAWAVHISLLKGVFRRRRHRSA